MFKCRQQQKMNYDLNNNLHYRVFCALTRNDNVCATWQLFER